MSCWSSARMLIAYTSAFSKIGTLGRWPDRLHTTRGGVSDTELKELTVRPMGSPLGARAVITVTPVGNMLSVSRKARTAGSFLGTVMMKSEWPTALADRKPVGGPGIIAPQQPSVERDGH